MAAPSSFPIDQPLITEVYRLGLGGQEATLPRHRHSLTRDEVRTNQKARIIVATIEEVTERSYALTSSRALFERAGVSSKTFYQHYSGKEAAFMEAYTLLDGVMLEATMRPVDLTDPRRNTREAVQRALDGLAAWPRFTRMRLVEGRAAGRIADQRRLEMAAAVTAVMIRAFDAAREIDDRVGHPSPQAVEALVAGLSELMTRHVTLHDASTLPSLAPVMVETIERFAYRDPPPYEPAA